MRYFVSRNLNPHVTAGYHDSVCCCNNLVDIFDTLAVLNLGDNIHMLCMMLF